MRSLFPVLPLLFPVGALLAQTPAVPITKEAKHHLVLTNDFARVFDVTVPAGDSTLYHVHPNDYTYVVFGAVDLKAQPLGGPATDLKLADGEVRFTKAPISHRVVNPSTVPFHNLTIEMLKSSGVPLSTSPAGVIALENDRVRVERIVLQPGQSTAQHTHTGPELDVALTDGTLTAVGADGKKSPITYRRADYRWNARARSHALLNAGKAPMEIVEIDWK